MLFFITPFLARGPSCGNLSGGEEKGEGVFRGCIIHAKMETTMDKMEKKLDILQPAKMGKLYSN